MEAAMHRFHVVLAVLLLVPASAVHSQEPLPSRVQPGGQQQPGARQAPGQPGRGIGNSPGNAVPGQADNAAYQQQVSYALGHNFAMNLRANEIAVDFQSLMAGITDVLRGAQPKYTDEQIDATLERFEQDMQQKAMVRMRQVAAKNQQEEAAFLAQNKGREGVQTTASGLQFRVLRQGNGPSPMLTDMVKCNYRGTLLNGTEFDSSAKHGGPQPFPVNQVIPGWTEALQKMHVGDKWQLFVPSKLAYDMRPRGPQIEPGSMLVFEIELLDIVKK
jgi:FKBP-type peptidyl-prolyl cis-trans isomerase FklB